MKLPVLVGVFVFALAVMGKHFLLEKNQSGKPLQLQLQEACDLHQAPCVAHDTAGRSIRFSLSPATIPLMQELTASVDLQGLENIRRLHLRIESVNMSMGYQQATLKAGADKMFSGKLMLPVCSREKMLWKARVTANVPGGEVVAEFPFETVR
jgi:hypothetical protein